MLVNIDEAQAEKERYKLENANVLNLEERRDHLEKMKFDLEGQVGQLQADASRSRLSTRGRT